MASLAAVGVHILLDGKRLGIEGHIGTQFAAGGGADAFGGGFLEANDASGNVPARSVGLILSPGEQRAAALVALILDQEIDIDKRRKAAEKEEELFRQTAAGLRHPGVQHCKGLSLGLIHHAGCGCRLRSVEVDPFSFNHGRPLHHLRVNGADVLAKHTHAKELNRSQKENSDHQGSGSD